MYVYLYNGVNILSYVTHGVFKYKRASNIFYFYVYRIDVKILASTSSFCQVITC